MPTESWGSTEWSKAAKEASMTEAQEKFDAQRREAEQRARTCQCRRPVPAMRSYMGVRPCVVCKRVVQ